MGYDAGTFLYETLSRLELPAFDEIPDAGEFDGVDGPDEWTVPHTDITIARIEEGPRKGEFLFSSATVSRANEFFRKMQALPYVRDVPMANTQQIRQVMPGWWLSAASIHQLPQWMRHVVLEQAVWKWIALAILLSLTLPGALAAPDAVHDVTLAAVLNQGLFNNVTFSYETRLMAKDELKE